MLDLGGGTGYGAAVAATIVGAQGRVVTVEAVPELAGAARRNLADRANVKVVRGNALRAQRARTWETKPFNKILFSFCLKKVPKRFLEALPEGGRLLAPLLQDSGNQQVLKLFSRRKGRIVVTEYGNVLYGPARS